jgi:hypothetical protein
MREPFEIIDPTERFREAKEEEVSAGVGTATRSRQTRPSKALWLAGAAIFAIGTLILVNSLSPRIGRDFDPGVNNQSNSDTAAQPLVSSRQPASDLPVLPAAPPRAQSVHAIDPEASPAQSPAPSHPIPGIGDQLLKLTSAVSIRNGPSASADIIGTAYAGAEVRVASRNSGWVQIVDPSSGRAGWIDSTVLSPPLPPVDTASTEDFAAKQMSEDQPTGAVNEPPLEQGVEISEEDALAATVQSKPATKAKKHSSKRHYGRKRFAVRFKLRRLFRR